MLHVIEGWWDGCASATGERAWSATDAAASCCAAVQRARPGDIAIVLGPRAAAERVRSLGVSIVATVCPPARSPVLVRRTLARTVQDIRDAGAEKSILFAEGVMAWSPSAMEACEGLDAAVIDGMSTTGPASPPDERSRDEARTELLAMAGLADGRGVTLIGMMADPPESSEALLAAYGVGIAEKAGALGGSRAIVFVPRGLRDLSRGVAMVREVGHDARLVEVDQPLGMLLPGLDVGVILPLTEACEHLPHLHAARAWWGRGAQRPGVRVIAGPGDAWLDESAGNVRVAEWGRAGLARGIAAVTGGIGVSS